MKSARLSAKLAAPLCAAFLPCAVMAQTVPPSTDGGALRQQIERDAQANQPAPAPVPKLDVGSAPTAKGGEGEVFVKGFRYDGNTLIGDGELNALVAGYAGKKITISQLHWAAQEISTLYSRRGWLVRVFIPQQNITSGIITVRVVEAQLGKIQLQGRSRRVSSKRISGIVGAGERQF